MTGLLAAAMASREAERVAGLCGPRLCRECFKPLPTGGKGRTAKIHQTPECRAAYLHRTRYGWRKPAGHKPWIPAQAVRAEVIAARAEFKAAQARYAAARAKARSAR